MVRYYLITAILRAFGILPLGVQKVLGRGLAALLRYVVRYRLKVVRSNVDLAFPEKTPQEREKIVGGFYRHLGRLIAEAVWLGACGPRRFARSGIFRNVNPELARGLWEQSPSGLMILYSHNCNWEIIGGIAHDGKTGFTYDNTVVVYRRVKDPVWDRIFRQNRTGFLPCRYENYVETAQLARYALSHRGEKRCYIMITDQRPYLGNHCPTQVEFFGKKVYTMDGGAALALKLGMPVVYLSITRTAKGYDYTYIPVGGSSSQEIMDNYYRLLEEDIRRDPCTYLWSHKRWK